MTTRSEEETAEEAAWQRFTDALDEADHGQKIEMIREKLREVPSGGLDGELAFDLIGTLNTSLRCTERWTEFKDDLEQLRELHPDTYESERMWFDLWCTENAILSGVNPTPDFLRLCAGANKVIDSFFHVLEMMRYHGHHDALLQGLPVVFDVIEQDGDIMEHTSADVGNIWLDLVLHDRLKRDPELRADDAQLKEVLSRISLINQEVITSALELRQQARKQTWTSAFFSGDVEQMSRSFVMLLWSFDAMLAHKTDWPAARRDQARLAIFKMLQEMARIDSEENPVRNRKRTQKTPQKTKTAASRQTRSFLVPDEKKLDGYLAGCFRPFFGSPYEGEVLLQALPWWLAFLAEHGLEDRTNAQRIWQAVREQFTSSILKIVTQPDCDRVLAQHMRETFDTEVLPVVAQQD